ncbi:hypothetical protein [Pelagibius sp. Alg239-R121]|nr:hypothetical protein [Pelagibius sp. Alg239-R121]
MTTEPPNPAAYLKTCANTAAWQDLDLLLAARAKEAIAKHLRVF